MHVKGALPFLRTGLWVLVACVLFFGFSESSQSQTVKPLKRAPLQLFEKDPIVFGTVIAINGPAQIIINPNGSRKIIGDVILKKEGDIYSAGRIAISGERNTQVDIVFDRTQVILPEPLDNPQPKPAKENDPATVTDFVFFSRKLANLSEVARLNYFGMDTVFVGATLSLTPNSPLGTYKIPLDVELAY